MANRIVSFFNKFNLFSEKQFGFMKNRSTQDAVMNFTENVYDALNQSKHNVSILIDLKSAFDTVNHDILLEKLELYGIRGFVLDWFRTYLCDRKFKVSVNDISSSTRTVNIGIPQGSILGPLLFIIYNNDLPSISDKISTTLFADDTNFSVSHSNYDILVNTLNNELSKILDWTVANRLTINYSKTEAMLFSNRKNAINFENRVSLNGIPLNYVNSARFLGVMIDNNLNFKSHIDNLVNKVSKLAGILYKIKDCFPISTKLMYYNSFVLPHLTYNILHWGGTNDVHLQSLVVLQKRIVRTIANANFYDHTSPLFSKFKILKLKDLYRFYAVLDAHNKIKNGLYSVSHDRHTRNCNLALPKFHRLTRSQQSCTFKGPSYWNEIPNNIRDIESISSFKNEVKSYYINLYIS